MRNMFRTACSAAVAVTAASAAVMIPAPVSGAAVACPASVTIPARTLPQFFPPLRGGDTEFAEHGPAITVAAKRQVWASATDTVRVVVTMRAEETQSDWSKAEGSRSFILYTAPAGCHIDTSWLPYGAFDSNGYLAKPLYANPYPLTAGDTDTVNRSFVSGYKVWDARAGSDIAAYTSVQVGVRAFTVKFTT